MAQTCPILAHVWRGPFGRIGFLSFAAARERERDRNLTLSKNKIFKTQVIKIYLT
jgi:hypothetical protein